jgi:hypothetical protein
MPRKDKCEQCSSFTAAPCIHSCHFLLRPVLLFFPDYSLPLHTMRQRTSHLHHQHTQLEPIMALTDFSNNHCYRATLQHVDVLCTTQFHKFCDRFMLNFGDFSTVSKQYFHAFLLVMSQAVCALSNYSPISKYNIQNFSLSPVKLLFTR